MHILEKYALGAEAKIGKPFIYEKYFPLGSHNYITFHAGEHQSKIYSHWCEVIDLITPALEKLGISIIQIGGKNEAAYDHCTSKLGATSYAQTAYILKGSKLHFGIDSFASQIASHYGKKVVSLFSHVLPQHKKPYWSEPCDLACFQPKLKEGKKPSYSYWEGQNKNIDSINPEEVATQILSFLEVDFTYEYSTQFIGQEYDKNYVDIVPNTTERAYHAEFGLARIRMDLEHNLDGLRKNLEIGRKFVIITSKSIDLQLLSAYKNKIASFIFVFDSETDDEENGSYISELSSLNFPNSNYLTFDKASAARLKLKYMDDILVHVQNYSSKEESGLTNFENLFYKSSKRILSEGKYYSSTYHYENDLPSRGFSKEAKPIVDNEIFWRDLNYFNLIKRID